MSMYPNNNIRERQEIMNLGSVIDPQAKITFQVTCASVMEKISSQESLINQQGHQQEKLQGENY